MSRALVTQYELGQDEHPDLLSVSISTTDYVGHTFGVDSWEYLDVLIETDKALTAFVDELSAKTDLAMLLTSDHGGTPLAETSQAAGKPGGRLYADTLVAELEKKADKKLGKRNWIQSYIQPYLYLHNDARESKKRDKLLALISAYAAKSPKMEAAFPSSEARNWRKDESWLKRDVANTVAAVTDAIFVVPAKGHVASPKEGTLGTGHGTPWDEDREVPVIAYGVGVSKAHSKDVQEQNRVAPTIASLLGIEWHLPTSPLPGVGEAPAPKE
jgi:predicted AlkP superfamily pyrophosphatase or phosphodiesterase